MIQTTVRALQVCDKHVAHAKVAGDVSALIKKEQFGLLHYSWSPLANKSVVKQIKQLFGTKAKVLLSDYAWLSSLT